MHPSIISKNRPGAYGPEAFNRGIPGWILLVENFFRSIVFVAPAFLSFDFKEKKGWIAYGAGLALYLASYLIHIVLPASFAGGSLLFFTASAWSTALWFAGIALVCRKTWLPFAWKRRHYFAVAALFLFFHVLHAGLTFLSRS